MANKVRFVDSLKVGAYQGAIGPEGPQGPPGESGTFPFTGSAGIKGELDVDGGITGSSFTGSFIGDGSGLTGLPGSTPFPFSGSAQITGSLGITGSLEILGNVTSSNNISASGDIIANDFTGSSFTGSFVGDGSSLINLPTVDTFPFSGSAQITGSLGITGSLEILGNVTSSNNISASGDIIATNFTGSSFTGSFVGDGSGLNNLQIPDAFPFTGSAQVTGSLGVTGSLEILGNVTSSDNIIANDFTGSSFTGSFVGDGSSLINLPVQSSFPFTGSAQITGSLGITGSAQGDIVTLSIASQTASLDISAGNFQRLTLASSTNTHLVATNIIAGSVTNLEIIQPTTSGSLSLQSNFKFSPDSSYTPSAPYTASATASVSDVLSIINFDGTNLFTTVLKSFS